MIIVAYCYMLYEALLLNLLHVVTSFPWDIVGGVWDLIVSVPDHCPLQF